MVVIVCRPGPDANFFLVVRKRFLNLGGRFRSADQILAFLTRSAPPRERHSRSSRFRRACRHCVGSASVFPRALGGTADRFGHPGDALDEADTLKVTLASAGCADCGGFRYSPRRDNLQSFCFDSCAALFSSGSGRGSCFCRHLCSDSGVLGTLLNSSDPRGVGILLSRFPFHEGMNLCRHCR